MAFKGLFTGGACQPSGERFTQASNPLTTFVDAALVRPMGGNQMIYRPSGPVTLESAFNQPLPMAAPIQLPTTIQPRPYLIQQTPNAEQLNSFWDTPIEKRADITHGPESFGTPWFRSFEPFNKEAPMVEDSKSQVNIKGTAEEIIREMENSQNPKFKESKFLKFLRKLKSGAYTITPENTLIKNPELLARFKEEKKEGEEDIDPFDVFNKYWDELNEGIDFRYIH